MFICVYYSFTDYGLGGVKGFAGLSNYIKLFQDPIFHRGFLNTVLMVVVAVPSCHCILPVGELRHLQDAIPFPLLLADVCSICR